MGNPDQLLSKSKTRPLLRVLRGLGEATVSLPKFPKALRRLDKVGPMAAAVASKVQSLASSMDEVNVEFALKMSAEAGIVLAAGGVEANFKVSLKWKKP